MRVGLYNLEPFVRNFALDKIRIYHERKGDTVLDCGPMEALQYDVIYASSIFDWTPKRYITPNMIVGGTGIDLTTVLPPEIEAIEPHKNYGYTTRGCFRKCLFCVVDKKEGGLRAVGDILSLWDGESNKITCLDNNALGIPDHFRRNCEQAIKYHLRIDWNQGLDHRLLTPELVDLLKATPHEEYRFAFDRPSYAGPVEQAIKLLKEKGINRASWYVLVGFDTTFEEDLFRLNLLRSSGQKAYVQRYRSKDKKLGTPYRVLAEWANRHKIFYSMTWEEFKALPENRMAGDNV